MFELKYTPEAEEQYRHLEKSKSLQKRFKALKKALRLLSEDPRHPSLNTHKYTSLIGPEGAEAFEAYAENNTPGAYRIFWAYYPLRSKTITILAITPHP